MATNNIDTKAALTMYVGESKNFTITVLDENCDPIDLSSHVLYFSVKDDICKIEPGDVLVYKDSTVSSQIEILSPESNGKATIKIGAADIAGLDIQSYFYDVWLELPSGVRRLISGPAAFSIQQPVTVQFTAPP